MNEMNGKQECINGVKCGVGHCKYHTTENRCTAGRINVQNESAMKKAETFCSTYETRTY